MRNLVMAFLLVLPMIGCSQIGFWDNPQPELPGCGLYTIQTNNCEACISRLQYVDCRGDQRDVSVNSNGGSITVCALSRPAAINNNPPLVGIASITRTGWCTEPIAFDYQFFFESHSYIYQRFWRGLSPNEGAQGVAIFSVNEDGSDPVFITTVYRNIPEAFQFNDTDPDKNYFRVDISARDIAAGSENLPVYISFGRSFSATPPRAGWESSSYVTRSFIFRKSSGVITTTAPRP